MSNHDDGSFTVEYCARSAGRHRLGIWFNDSEIDGSPFSVIVSSS